MSVRKRSRKDHKSPLLFLGCFGSLFRFRVQKKNEKMEHSCTHFVDGVGV